MSSSLKSKERTDVLKKRQALSSEYISSASLKICKLITNFNQYQKSKYISCYYPFKNEVNLLPILKDNSKQFLFPKVVKGSKKLEFYHINSLDQFEPGTYGVMEPVHGCKKIEIENIDLFLTPGVAFSKKGERIGYGGGYYDTSLSFRKNKSTILGVCFDIQIIANGFSDEWDQKINYLVSESGLIKC